MLDLPDPPDLQDIIVQRVTLDLSDLLDLPDLPDLRDIMVLRALQDRLDTWFSGSSWTIWVLGTQVPPGSGASSCVFKTLSNPGMQASSFSQQEITATEQNVCWVEDCESWLCLILFDSDKKITILLKITLQNIDTNENIYWSKELSKCSKASLKVRKLSHRPHRFWESKLISSLLSLKSSSSWKQKRKIENLRQLVSK